MPGPTMTTEQAQELAARLLGPSKDLLLTEFRHGWLVQENLPQPPRDRAAPTSVGQGNAIIDRDGVVTVHSSLPPDLILEEYSRARTENRYTGLQIWPPTTPS